jgi:competence protein ComEC
MFERIANSPSRSLAVISLAYIAGLALVSALGLMPPPGKEHPPLILQKFTDALRTSITRTLPEPHAGFLTGLLTGGSANVSPDFRAALVSTGTIHLLALSGWNISLIIRSFGNVLLALPLSRRARFTITSTATILFVLAVGAAPSVVRAAIMGLLLVIVELIGRPRESGRMLLVAVTLMLVISPTLVGDLSFLLSVAAMLGLIYIGPIIKPFFKRLPEWFGIRENAIASIAATFATAPLIIFTFGRFSFISLPANLLLLPSIPYAMGVGFIGACIGILSEALGRLIGIATTVILGYGIAVVRLLARVPGNQIIGLHFSSAAAVVMTLGMVGAVVLKIRSTKSEIRNNIKYQKI